LRPFLDAAGLPLPPTSEFLLLRTREVTSLDSRKTGRQVRRWSKKIGPACEVAGCALSPLERRNGRDERGREKRGREERPWALGKA
jgi:hypothetical protein